MVTVALSPMQREHLKHKEPVEGCWYCMTKEDREHPLLSLFNACLSFYVGVGVVLTFAGAAMSALWPVWFIVWLVTRS